MKAIEVTELPDEVRALVRECEVTGKRTAFARGPRNVAVLVTWDEYLALRETIDVARDETLRSRIAGAAAAVRGNDLLLIEDLLDNQ